MASPSDLLSYLEFHGTHRGSQLWLLRQLHFKDIIRKIIHSFTQTMYCVIVCMKHCQAVTPGWAKRCCNLTIKCLGQLCTGTLSCEGLHGRNMVLIKNASLPSKQSRTHCRVCAKLKCLLFCMTVCFKNSKCVRRGRQCFYFWSTKVL